MKSKKTELLASDQERTDIVHFITSARKCVYGETKIKYDNGFQYDNGIPRQVHAVIARRNCNAQASRVQEQLL